MDTLILDSEDAAVAADIELLLLDQDSSDHLSITATLTKGSKCILYNLSSAQMNGKLCKIVGSYRHLDDRFPVYVYATKETALIKPENLRCVHTKSSKTRAVIKQSSPEPTSLLPMIIQNRDDIAITLVFKKRNRERTNSAKLFAQTMIRDSPHKNLYKRNELTDDLKMILNDNCFYIRSFFNGPHNMTLFNNLQADLGAERWYGFLDRDLLGKTKSNMSLSGGVAMKKSFSFQLIVQKLADYFNVDVRMTAVNMYRDEDQYVPFHHDNGDSNDKREWLTIGASFGFTRALDFLHVGATDYERKRHMHNRIGFNHSPMKQRFSIPQLNGDVFAFSSKMNVLFKHSVPRVHDKKCGPRFSVMVWGTKKDHK